MFGIEKLNGEVSEMVMLGETSDKNQFCETGDVLR